MALALRTVLIPVADLDAAIDFYTDGLGLEVKFRDGDRYLALDGGACTLALATADEHPAPDGVAVAFKADDVAEAVRVLVAAGAEVVRPPSRGDHEMRALLHDPAGTALVVYGPR
ncbi:VOC family protein [Saccharopolyspora sp. NPDC050389]|uniref:VOC family protein n=1 Tax=Saccharopolyspora sp. NPDC050389 TaxID=3155516 RepID=UPI00340265D1